MNVLLDKIYTQIFAHFLRQRALLNSENVHSFSIKSTSTKKNIANRVPYTITIHVVYLVGSPYAWVLLGQFAKDTMYCCSLRPIYYTMPEYATTDDDKSCTRYRFPNDFAGTVYHTPSEH